MHKTISCIWLKYTNFIIKSKISLMPIDKKHQKVYDIAKVDICQTNFYF